jgi:transcriptional regulator with XRE-family HTH domain
MISDILKYLRKSKKLKQSEVASTANIAVSTISGYETNYSQPTFEMIEKIADICGYDIIFRDRKTEYEVTSKNIDRIKE